MFRDVKQVMKYQRDMAICCEPNTATERAGNHAVLDEAHRHNLIAYINLFDAMFCCYMSFALSQGRIR